LQKTINEMADCRVTLARVSFAPLTSFAGFPSQVFSSQVFISCVPVARVRPEEAAREVTRRDRIEKRAAEIDRASAGLPVGVQLVGRAWHEHEVLAAMAAVEQYAGGFPDFPRTPVTRLG
jgi:fatty acid amide hydrolase